MRESLTPDSNLQVKACVFGSSHSVALSEDGQVFTWGGGLGGALGRGGLDDELEPAKVEEELSNTKMDARGLPVVTCRRVQAIAAAEDYVLVLVEDGKLFCWGNAAGVLVPARELEGELDGRRVVKLFSGYSSAQHRAVITEEEIVIVQGEETSVQRLFTWGRGDEGQLGNGRDRVLDSNHTNASAPELITRGLAEGESISAVSLGGFHTLVLTSSGQVYACGRGSEGQLGPRFFSQGDTRQVPGHVLHPVGGVLLDACIIQVSAGLHTSAALSDNGRVWLWGLESANNQWEEQRVFDWGDGCPNAWIPLEVKGLKGPANHFSCGRAHYAVLCEHDIMTWGEGTFGQLAHGNRAHMSHPRSSPVPLREST